ncbi:MAG: type II secretion system GspH family protein [Gammaproteobacteria bacterium]|nr:type II secretion system GspH family protein [Gammaproteobacteria bacterium]
MTIREQRGFTLLELVMVIVLVALASIPILGQFSQASGTLLTDEIIQTAAQLAQERAEGLLADRRNTGYAAVPTGTVNDVLGGAWSSYSRTVTVTSPPGGSGCAAGATCKEVVVSVDHSGRTRAEVTLMLVSY